VEFVAIPYKEVKDVFILGGIEEVQVRPGVGGGGAGGETVRLPLQTPC
jgi:hypothetical protein